MPTRLPYGLSFIKPGSVSGAYTFTSGDVTPDVSLGTVFFTATSAVTITNFDGGERGKVIIVFSGSGGVTTIQNSAGGINTFSIIASNSAGFVKYSSGTSTYLMENKESLMYLHNGTDWSQISPSLRLP